MWTKTRIENPQTSSTHFGLILHTFSSVLTCAILGILQGVPEKKKTKTGEDITSKLGQLHPSMFRFLKAHLFDIKCV